MNKKMYHILWPILLVIMKVFHPYRVYGKQNIPEGGAVLCGNHSTLGDPLYVITAIGVRNKIHILAKEELMEIPLLGGFLRKWGVIGIRRGKADVGAIKEALRLLKSGEKLLLFPEGTRIREGQVGEAHTGAAMFATRTGVPIIPVYITPQKHWFFRRIKIVFGTPYKPEYEGKRATPEDYERIANDIMDRVHALELVE